MSRRPLSLYAVNVASSTLTRVLQLTVLVWVNQYLLRRIAPDEYSLLPLVMSLLVFAEVFRHIFTGGLARFIVEADARGDHEQVTRITSSMMPVLAVGAGLIGAAAGVALWQIDSILRISPDYVWDARLMLGLQAFVLCVNLLCSPFTTGPYVRQRFVVINGIELGTEALRVLILLSLLFGVSTEVRWLVVASALSSAAGLVWRFVLTRRMVPAIGFRRSLVSWATARQLLSFGAWTSIEGLVDLVAKTAPLLFLNRFSTPVQVASFHVGRLADIQLRRVITAAARPAQPALTSLYATDGRGALNEFYYRGGRYLMWLALFLVGPLIVLGQPLMRLYAGDEYTAAGLIMLVLLARYPFVFASSMYYRVSHAMGVVRGYYLTQVLNQTLTLGGLILAVGVLKLNAFGAALAIGVTDAVVHLFVIWPLGLQMVKGTFNLFLRRTLIPGLLPFVFALFTAGGVARLVDVDTWAGIITCTAASVAVYLLTLFGLCLDDTDRDLVRRAFARLSRRRRGSVPATAANARI